MKYGKMQNVAGGGAAAASIDYCVVRNSQGPQTISDNSHLFHMSRVCARPREKKN